MKLKSLLVTSKVISGEQKSKYNLVNCVIDVKYCNIDRLHLFCGSLLYLDTESTPSIVCLSCVLAEKMSYSKMADINYRCL